jgi:predicted dehydrogenase
MNELRFALIGAGFWARYQLAGWREVSGARCVAVYNRTRSRGETLAAEFGVQAVFDDAEALIREVRPDFVDIVTDVDSHAHFVQLAAEQGVPAICQKANGCGSANSAQDGGGLLQCQCAFPGARELAMAAPIP